MSFHCRTIVRPRVFIRSLSQSSFSFSNIFRVVSWTGVFADNKRRCFYQQQSIICVAAVKLYDSMVNQRLKHSFLEFSHDYIDKYKRWPHTYAINLFVRISISRKASFSTGVDDQFLQNSWFKMSLICPCKFIWN